MGNKTEFSLRTVPMLLGVIEANVTRGDDFAEPLDISMETTVGVAP